METIKNKRLKELMTTNIVTSHPTMLMTDISQIFDQHNFHHLPVLDKQGVCLGIISKSDYLQLQDSFTKINNKNTNMSKNSIVLNDRLFKTLMASDVMSENPICMDVNETVNKALSIFLENSIHSVVVTDNNQCVGIITPHDILKLV